MMKKRLPLLLVLCVFLSDDFQSLFQCRNAGSRPAAKSVGVGVERRIGQSL